MLIAIDIGNTNVVVGVFEGENTDLRTKWRLQSNIHRTTDEYMVLMGDLMRFEGITADQVRGVVVSSVVTPLTRIFRKLSVTLFRKEPLIISAGIKTGMPIRTDNPREVGADRIVNAVAGYAQARGAVIVVDFGTATTFDVVNFQGCYVGGCIMPGVNVSLEALVERTDRLPLVEIDRPRKVVGRNTVNSLQSGIYYGYVSMIQGISHRIIKEEGCRFSIIATGGLGSLFHLEEGLFDEYIHDLTLQGLKILYERNRA
ncbi:type III pantothenate kinase [Desulfurispira natronophila]|uniref:Type III pantothenate kinase n=1 Tax=Desulfurispira natronophila TaxID=682562 RepID=A0A7W8DGM1_9BACT|nr:type III pantothenate kinase [Desulfurispira natronophila]MBB5021408.1 type III pantothenate kinase [Desulfurispira natronophila]